MVASEGMVTRILAKIESSSYQVERDEWKNSVF